MATHDTNYESKARMVCEVIDRIDRKGGPGWGSLCEAAIEEIRDIVGDDPSAYARETESKAEGPAGWLMFNKHGEPAGEWCDAAGGFTDDSVRRELRELDEAEPLDAPHSFRPVYFTRDTECKSVAVGSPSHVAAWDAINAYAQACGGHVEGGHGATARQAAVVAVESALAGLAGTRAMECRSVSRVESALLDLECETQDRGDPWHNGAWYVIRKIREAFDGTDCGSVGGKDGEA